MAGNTTDYLSASTQEPEPDADMDLEDVLDNRAPVAITPSVRRHAPLSLDTPSMAGRFCGILLARQERQAAPLMTALALSVPPGLMLALYTVELVRVVVFGQTEATSSSVGALLEVGLVGGFAGLLFVLTLGLASVQLALMGWTLWTVVGTDYDVEDVLDLRLWFRNVTRTS